MMHKCYWCGKEFKPKRKPRGKKQYCSKACLCQAMAKYNREENPINKKEYWTKERCEEKRKAVLATCKDEGKAYRKFHQRHLHRIVAEEKLGRPLEENEIVHHINGDKLDNRPENLQVMTQSEHASMHFREYWRKKKGGDENECSKE